MLRPDPAAAERVGALWSAAPTPALGGGDFAAVFKQMHAEVKQVIENGWSGDNVLGMRPEGQFYRNNQMISPAAAAALSDAQVPDEAQREFLSSIAPWAQEASRSLGVSPNIVAAHAALESGWGRRPLRDSAGQDTHNLFGIKAQPGWQGARVEALTTEYQENQAVKKVDGFRSYPDYASAFRDYAKLLQDNPRYREALNTGNDANVFARALARGGYATDPTYAAKLAHVARQIQSLD
jgi:flagellar protein FlgJ